ncbi:MAG TPA: hypothetical protein VMF69_02530 [Gemmataceae bacterium]|nr:hypothetical protein [Gemmataceae bacterium]
MAPLKDQCPLFSVEFTFIVVGQGLTAHCCVPDPTRVPIQVGDSIEFVRPDGSILQTTVNDIVVFQSSIEIFKKDGRPGLVGLVLPKNVEKDDIPQGTKLRLAGDGGSAGGE